MYDYYEPLISPSDLAEMLHCGLNSAYKMLREGKIKAFRVGKTWKIPKRAVQQYILEQTKMSSAIW